MCGIGGVFSWSETGAFDATRTSADLCSALAHRGPDGEGTFTDRGLLMVHRRLAIIDPTPGGRQPMTTPDGRYSLVYNGEIYNYRELRTDLERAGVRFTSTSDTEVLLALIVRDGIAALSRAPLAVRGVPPGGVVAFLAGSYTPPPLTWLRGVESLAPGAWKRWH